MHNVFFFGIVDPTEVIFSAFVLFFGGLIVYLRREDRREGYPLEDEGGRLEPAGGLLFTARPKTFILPHGQGTLTKPNNIRESQDVAARPLSRAPGSPLEPNGDPMLAGVGPGAYAHRARTPDVMLNGEPKIAPLRAAPGFFIGRNEGDPRGMSVVGADGVVGGIVSDVWVDRAEYMIRYLEVAVSPEGVPAKHVLVPMTMAVIKKSRKTVRVDAILGSQFAQAPVLASPDQVTMDEEERVCAYYGGGFLYATKARSEPYL